MKWYIWLAIAIALGLIIWAVTKNKSSPAVGAGLTASNTPSNNSSSGGVGFNPYQLTQIV